MTKNFNDLSFLYLKSKQKQMEKEILSENLDNNENKEKIEINYTVKRKEETLEFILLSEIDKWVDLINLFSLLNKYKNTLPKIKPWDKVNITIYPDKTIIKINQDIFILAHQYKLEIKTNKQEKINKQETQNNNSDLPYIEDII